jgi:hypothetical protein
LSEFERRYGVKSGPGQCRAEALRCDPLAPSRHAHDQGDNEENEEDEEQDLRDAGRSGRDTAEAEDRRDYGDNEEDQSPTQHCVLRGMSLK